MIKTFFLLGLFVLCVACGKDDDSTVAAPASQPTLISEISADCGGQNCVQE